MKWIPRFHLSTALAMMLTAGVMLGLNLRPSVERISEDNLNIDDLIDLLKHEFTLPFDQVEIEDRHADNPNTRGTMELESIKYGWPCAFKTGFHREHYEHYETHPYFIVINAAAALVMVIVVGILCEWLFARRCKLSVQPL